MKCPNCKFAAFVSKSEFRNVEKSFIYCDRFFKSFDINEAWAECQGRNFKEIGAKHAEI